jgi:hypothetical protein
MLNLARKSLPSHRRERNGVRRENLTPSLLAVVSLDRYLDLLILRERIAGRLPAFEGIRVVKERVEA